MKAKYYSALIVRESNLQALVMVHQPNMESDQDTKKIFNNITQS